MRLYLMRHGKAGLNPVDEQRPLAERGIADVQMVAQHLADTGVSVSRVYHSTLVRAQQTAELMGRALNPVHAPEQRLGIEPWGDVKAFAALANSWDEDTLVCGHEPFMGQAALAFQGDDPIYIQVKTATVMAFERTDAGWNLAWVVNPGRLKGETS